MKEVPLTRGYVAIVDDEDYEAVANYKWYALVSTRKDSSVLVYAARSATINGHRRTLLMHKMLFETSPGQEIDHIDCNGTNNTRANLRICTKAQNQYNQQQRKGSSKYKGVYWNKPRKKWQAYIHIDGIAHFLGRFESEDDAANAYNVAASQNFGNFARINTCG